MVAIMATLTAADCCCHGAPRIVPQGTTAAACALHRSHSSAFFHLTFGSAWRLKSINSAGEFAQLMVLSTDFDFELFITLLSTETT